MKTRHWLKEFWRDYEWPIIWILSVLACVLGVIGFEKNYLARGLDRTILDFCYYTLQLFVLESGAIDGPVSWELELARFLAPAMAAYTATQALTIIFQKQLHLLRLRWIRGHVVIVGLGRKGWLFARSFQRKGYPITVIEQDEDNDRLEQCREEDILAIIGNATDREVLRKAHIERAAYVISVCGEDGVNAEVAVRAREAHRSGSTLTCLVHIVQPQLCSLLRRQEVVAQREDGFRLQFFNVFESAARALWHERPLWTEESARPSLLVVGLGRMGESLVLHATREWGKSVETNGDRFRITVLDRFAAAKVESLKLRYPHLESICELRAIDMDFQSPDFYRGDFLFDSKGDCDASGVYVCLDNDSFSLSTALILHRRLIHHKVPIIVRMTQEAGLATLLRGEEGSSFQRLYTFGVLDRICNTDLLLAGTHEVLARAIHEDYVHQQRKKGETLETNPHMVAWEELPDSLKESNRRQADHIGRKLMEVGCDIAQWTDWNAPFSFTPEEVEQLARLEHVRWLEEHMKEGWRYAPPPKDPIKKMSPYIMPYDQLPDDIKESNRNTVRELPNFLSQAGFQIYRVG